MSDQTQTTSTSQERSDDAHSKALSGRFLRVTITGAPAGQAPALTEVEATGILTAQ